jgi:nucleotide-binding universal stress UspA family protein
MESSRRKGLDDPTATEETPMTPAAIVSYDDTLNDLDALMLARVLADAGTTLTLAYVRHTTQAEPDLEELEEHDAETLLQRGARWLGDLDVDRRVIVSASTAAGLKWLAEQENADIVVFGSDYRTAVGHVSPQQSAQTLLEGGPAAVAIAPADYRSYHGEQIERIGLLADAGDEAATQTATELAEQFGASVTREERGVDLLVVGSRSEARPGYVTISARAQNAIEESTAPVLVVARALPVRFAATVLAG